MVEPLPSATVLLLRPPLDVLMVQRNQNLSFMGGYWTFPGGKLEPEDDSPEAAARRELTEETGIELPADTELVPFARWITPVALPRRYDTWFFLALGDGTAQVDGSEIVDARWITPADALAHLQLAFPTRKQLESMTPHASAAALLAAARDTPVEPILPEVVHNDGSPAKIVLP